MLLYSNPGGPRSIIAVFRLNVSVGHSNLRARGGALAFSAPSISDLKHYNARLRDPPNEVHRNAFGYCCRLLLWCCYPVVRRVLPAYGSHSTAYQERQPLELRHMKPKKIQLLLSARGIIWRDVGCFLLYFPVIIDE